MTITVPINAVIPRSAGNLRRVDPERVKALAASIAEIGLQNPISVSAVECTEHTPYAHEGYLYQLVAGEHRWRACEGLGQKSIEVSVLALSDIDLGIWSIDENLCRSELTALERAEHLSARKQLYLVKHPETEEVRKRGGPGRGKKKTNANNATVSFASDTAAKSGMSKRAVELSVKRGEDIAPSVKDAIRDTPIANSGVELDALAALPEEKQARAVAMVKSGDVVTIREAGKRLGRGKDSDLSAAVSLKETSKMTGKRQASLNNAHKERMITGLSMIAGVCRGMADLNPEWACADLTRGEIAGWQRAAKKHAGVLLNFANVLAGLNGKTRRVAGGG